MQLQNTSTVLIGLLLAGQLIAQPRKQAASVREEKIEYDGRGPIRELSFQGFCDFDSLSEKNQKRLTHVTSLSWSNVVAPVLPEYVPLGRIKNAELNEVVDDWCPLSYMYFAPFPQQVLQMKALERFTEMDVTFIPEQIVELKNLRYLEFESRNYNQMQFLPLTIGLLPGLDTFSLNLDYSDLTAELLFYRICNKDLKIVSRDQLEDPGKQYREYELPEIYYDTLLYSLAHHLMIYFDKGHTRLMMDGRFKNGLPDGDWFVYTEKGEVKEERHYKDGVAVGTWNSHVQGDKLTQQIVFSDSGYVLHNYEGNSEEQLLIVASNLQVKFMNIIFYGMPNNIDKIPGDTKGYQLTMFDSQGRITEYTSGDNGNIYEHHFFRDNYLLAQDVEGQCNCPEPKPELPMRVLFDQTGHWYSLECICDEK